MLHKEIVIQAQDDSININFPIELKQKIYDEAVSLNTTAADLIIQTMSQRLDVEPSSSRVQEAKRRAIAGEEIDFSEYLLICKR